MEGSPGRLASRPLRGRMRSPLPLLAGHGRFRRRTLFLLPDVFHRALQLSETFPRLFHTGFYLR